jgi:hypothetical protein
MTKGTAEQTVGCGPAPVCGDIYLDEKGPYRLRFNGNVADALLGTSTPLKKVYYAEESLSPKARKAIEERRKFLAKPWVDM